MFPELLSFPNCYLGAFFLLLVRTLPGNAFKAALAGFFCNGNNKPLLRSLEGATAATAKAFKGHAVFFLRFAVRATKSKILNALACCCHCKAQASCYLGYLGAFCSGNPRLLWEILVLLLQWQQQALRRLQEGEAALVTPSSPFGCASAPKGYVLEKKHNRGLVLLLQWQQQALRLLRRLLVTPSRDTCFFCNGNNKHVV